MGRLDDLHLMGALIDGVWSTRSLRSSNTEQITMKIYGCTGIIESKTFAPVLQSPLETIKSGAAACPGRS